MSSQKWVYTFDQVDEAESKAGSWEGARALLGGKGANLGEMTRLGVPVPPGFTISTQACIAYLKAGNQFPEGMWEQAKTALKDVEGKTGKRFGDPANPLLVSCRSGAKFSMPGMMDTVLNVGLNDKTAEGMIKLTQDARFVYDSYRRLVQMFGSVVLGIDDDAFEHPLDAYKKDKGYRVDTEMTGDDWKAMTQHFQEIVAEESDTGFPQEPLEQMRMATEAVFSSWNGKRAIDYRNAAGISHDLGTAVNIQTMVFGNMGDDSGTGVTFTRDPATGERILYGDYLTNAQGEDVVAGIRNTKKIAELEGEMPAAYAEFEKICDKLEAHYHEMQDVEFTIERGKLWMLQTRDGKRTAKAAVKIAVDMVEEGLIERDTAVKRVKPRDVDVLLHPQFKLDALEQAKGDRMLGKGVNASPGAAVGRIYFDADTAEARAKEDKQDVIMVRPFTKPDDVHGMLASKGILTTEGGATSHAAVVARQFGIPCVVGASGVRLDLDSKILTANGVTVSEGDWISVDGTTGEVYSGQIPTVMPEFEEQTELLELLGWADDIAARDGVRSGPEGFPTRGLEVWANADYPQDARRARQYGARGIGLCRTEHMFFEQERLPIVQRMILADSSEARTEALDELLPYQRADFEGLFEAMDGLPVIVRLIDPPLHEFLPGLEELIEEVATKKATGDTDGLEARQQLLESVRDLHESNPMMGLRGVRLSILMPEIVEMQVRAIFEAAANKVAEGIDAKPEVMIPLTGHVNELKAIQPRLVEIAREAMEAKDVSFPYKFGTMIEIPRAALTAPEIAGVAEFFSYGTNDLTQMTFGYSRDDAERNFLIEYVEPKFMIDGVKQGILPNNPFQTIDPEGVGRLMEIGTREGRSARPDLEVGICGEHGGDPASIQLCHRIGLNYVSCSPFRVPIARLSAAHAALGTG
ncbi:MAG TPA: pyruvate, phosphate dikinase [Anaerolineales bacterium]